MNFLKKIFWWEKKEENNSQNRLRATSKWLPVFDHRALWKCVIISKENHNWKWSLLWWWIEKHEAPIDALKRELKEELSQNVYVSRIKALDIIKTTKQKNHIHTVELGWKININHSELETIWFYPLENKWSEQRAWLEKNMDYHALLALQDFRENHNYKSYTWSSVKIPEYIFNEFHSRIKNILKQ